MALSVKAEIQVTGLGGGDLGVDGVPWKYATVSDLKTLICEELRLPANARQDGTLSFLAGNSGQALVDTDLLSDPRVRGRKLILRGAELPHALSRRQWFAAGVEVLLQGLQSAPELNGKRATVCAWDPLKCRYDVLMEATKLQKSVRPDNLCWAWVNPLLLSGSQAAGKGDRHQAHIPLGSAGDRGSASYCVSGTSGEVRLQADFRRAAGGAELAPPCSDPVQVTPVQAPPDSAGSAQGSQSRRGERGGLPLLLEEGPLREELERLKLEKARAVEREDYGEAAEVKKRQEELEALLAELPSSSQQLASKQEALEALRAEKAKAVENEDFKLASELKRRQQELEAEVQTLQARLGAAR